MKDCPNCEYHKQRAQLWRHEAYKLSGHPLDWEPDLMQRTWVGLTDEERRETINRAWNDYLRGEGDDSFGWYLSQAIEAKLKEKNNA